MRYLVGICGGHCEVPWDPCAGLRDPFPCCSVPCWAAHVRAARPGPSSRCRTTVRSLPASEAPLLPSARPALPTSRLSLPAGVLPPGACLAPSAHVTSRALSL